MTIKGGYYIKSRAIRDSWIAHSAPIDREVWDYLLREANHTQMKYHGYIIERGQLFRTYREIREALHWKVGCCKKFYSESAMKHCMKRLMNARMIELTKEPRGNVITVCKYDYYQDPKNHERTNERTNEGTSNEPAMNRDRAAINKNEEEEEEEEEENLKAREELFNTQFWGTYPKRKGKRVGKAKSLALFLKIPEEKMGRVIRGVRNLSVYTTTTDSYPKDPERWLKAELWEDWQNKHEPEQKKLSPAEATMQRHRDSMEGEG